MRVCSATELGAGDAALASMIRWRNIHHSPTLPRLPTLEDFMSAFTRLAQERCDKLAAAIKTARAK